MSNDIQPMPPVFTQGQQLGEVLVSGAIRAHELIKSVVNGPFVDFYGTPGNVRDRTLIIDALNHAGYARSREAFTRHREVKTLLVTNGWVDFEPWQLVAPYEVTFEDDGETITVGTELNPAWEVANE